MTDPFPAPSSHVLMSRMVGILCAEVPRVVPVFEPVGTAYRAKECWFNAQHYARTQRGSLVSGWSLWVNGDTLEAQHHAVVGLTNGSLVDVTPHDYGATRILFAPTIFHTVDFDRFHYWVSVRMNHHGEVEVKRPYVESPIPEERTELAWRPANPEMGRSWIARLLATAISAEDRQRFNELVGRSIVLQEARPSK